MVLGAFITGLSLLYSLPAVGHGWMWSLPILSSQAQEGNSCRSPGTFRSGKRRTSEPINRGGRYPSSQQSANGTGGLRANSRPRLQIEIGLSVVKSARHSPDKPGVASSNRKSVCNIKDRLALDDWTPHKYHISKAVGLSGTDFYLRVEIVYELILKVSRTNELYVLTI